MADKPTIHILGPGALGSLWAAKLSHDNEVILLVKPDVNKSLSPKHHSFQFINQNEATTITLPCEGSSTLPWEDGTPFSLNDTPIDTLLVFTKSYDTLKAVQQLTSRIIPSSRIVLFQNGMGSQQEVTQLLFNNTVYAASTTEGANRPDKQTVIYAGKGETWVGPISNKQSQLDAEKLSALLSSSGLNVSSSDNIWEKLWLKLAINCAINPFTALLDCKNGELIGQTLFDSNITPLCNELSEAMLVNGVTVSASELQSKVIDVIKKTHQNISSMLQDVRAGKQTEIEYINGYIEQIAQQNNRKFPTNLFLLEEVKRRF
ncbi:2-dehydropantoate 2-reductase [Alkalimarinus coralli]|uniref:2-dehydropantoate 2-reductase n=1 Tax=Alkalimarinus coralli TaxID=2935863 RepID=UPI00202B36C1|nr:2-dehydropantoate 2-reductase [Alkalimarinus coralli]